ncbi:hypothetical protein DRO64_00565 [Candidatus Bathyarchaeota archaeon]|nr:MAG: hypothetical protein DRO64_00565 [Candidatus Bathyarchaeota archaeon]
MLCLNADDIYDRDLPKDCLEEVYCFEGRDMFSMPPSRGSILKGDGEVLTFLIWYSLEEN